MIQDQEGVCCITLLLSKQRSTRLPPYSNMYIHFSKSYGRNDSDINMVVRIRFVNMTLKWVSVASNRDRLKTIPDMHIKTSYSYLQVQLLTLYCSW